MRFLRFALFVCVLIAGVGAGKAQSAQALMDKSAKGYAGAKSYSVEVDSRIVQVSFPPTPAGKPQGYKTTHATYRRQKFKVREPGDYFLATQAYSELQASVSSDSGITETHVAWKFIARNGSMTPREGAVLNGNYVISAIPDAEFNSALLSKMSVYSPSEVVLSNFYPRPNGSGIPRPNLVDLELVGYEKTKRPTYRVSAKTSEGHPVMLWIEEATHLVVRSVTQRPLKPPRNGSPSAAWIPRTLVIERLYKNQRLNPSLDSEEFNIPETKMSELRVSGAHMGFCPVDELITTIDAGPLAPTGAAAATNEEDATDSVPEPIAVTNTPETASATSLSGQALSYEQMSGIVIIEGDGETATGFMTKIRNVDFVVTNLHVLGGNKKISMKTLGGEEIPVLGVFGAAGADIAIIRIETGKGDLRLAPDVFRTSKIGDKVVVVGNRQGGGVATETAGNILGVGPTRIEVNANFEPGNSGSPIVSLKSGEVVGVASYAETRRIEVEDNESSAARKGRKSEAPKVEKRWFGYRVDSVAKWEAIDLNKWNAQEQRIDAFRELSDALVSVLQLDFSEARSHPRLNSIITGFQSRMYSSGGGIKAANEIKDFFRVVLSISEDGVRDLTSGDYYDYFRTSLYWETSIPAQLEYRRAVVQVLKKYEANSAGYLLRMREGS